MASACGGDPLVCIDLVVLAIGGFLRDWTTMAMLAVLLGLLLRLRADRQKAREAAYAAQIGAFENRRRQDRRRATQGFTGEELRRGDRRRQDSPAPNRGVERVSP